MADWMHCNVCYRTPTQNVKYYISSCGHVFCNKCINNGACNKTCKVCNQQAQVLEINRQIKPEMQQFFMDAKDIQKKSINNVNRVLAFQNLQKVRLSKFYQEQLKRASKMIGGYEKQIKAKVELEKAHKSLFEEHKKLTENYKQLELAYKKSISSKSSTPKSMAYKNRTSNDSNGPHLNLSDPNSLMNSFKTIDDSRTPHKKGISPFRGQRSQSPVPSEKSELTTPKMLGFNNKIPSTAAFGFH